jgi:hypothetical protein
MRAQLGRMLSRRIPGTLMLLLLPLWLSGCDGTGVITPGTGAAQRLLRSGAYDYRAWSDHGGRGPAWWGYLNLQVGIGGEISGTYELPRQCSDAYGYEATCYGRVGGRIYSDGTFRFGLDEGWLSHEGVVGRRSEATGRWQGRLLGYRDGGTFELIPY